MKRNKWKSWKYDTKYSQVRRKIKRKSNKRDRQIAKILLQKELLEY